MQSAWHLKCQEQQIAHSCQHKQTLRAFRSSLVLVRAAPSTPACQVGPVKATADFDRVGELKASAYYEDKPNTVYLKSSARQFAQQEARNWRQQVGRDPEGQAAVCLAAYVDDTVQGCLDLIKVPGQPAGSSQGGACIAYVRNVAVDAQYRRRALGTELLQSARQVAADRWQATQICAHVEHGNEAAGRLYEQCGYRAIDEAVMLDILTRRGVTASTGDAKQ